MNRFVAGATNCDEVFLGIFSAPATKLQVMDFDPAMDPQNWQRQPSRSKIKSRNCRYEFGIQANLRTLWAGTESGGLTDLFEHRSITNYWKSR